MSDELDEILKPATPAARKLARAVVAVIQKALPDAVEVVWPKQRIASYGVGPKKMSEHSCYVAVFEGHVNLGFYYGADLDDPKGLLEGTGKALRHIKLREVAQLTDPALLQLVAAAVKHYPKRGNTR